MLDLVMAGAIEPSAEDVAARAEVGLRSVFRHFNDMETLYREMSLRLAKQYELWLVPYTSTDWRGQLAETIERRLTTYEQLIPYRRAADAHRHKSPALQEEHDRTLRMMRARLQFLLPDAISGNPMAFETLDLLLSFDSWQRLRTDQCLPVETARAIIEAQVSLVVR